MLDDVQLQPRFTLRLSITRPELFISAETVGLLDMWRQSCLPASQLELWLNRIYLRHFYEQNVLTWTAGSCCFCAMVESEAHLQHVHCGHTAVEAVVRSVNIEKFLMGRKAHWEMNDALHSHQDERIRWDFLIFLHWLTLVTGIVANTCYVYASTLWYFYIAVAAEIAFIYPCVQSQKF